VFYFLKNDVGYEHVLSSMKRFFLKCRLTQTRSKDMKGGWIMKGADLGTEKNRYFGISI